MAQITSISEVNDIYDLIELYQNLDSDGDGKITALEYGRNVDVYDKDRDHALSPWEIWDIVERRKVPFDPFTQPGVFRTKEFSRSESVPTWVYSFNRAHISVEVPPEVMLFYSLQKLPPRLLGAIKKIRFPKQSDRSPLFTYRAQSEEYAIVFSSIDQPLLDLHGPIIHEAAHLRTFQLKELGSDFEKRWMKTAASADNEAVYGRYEIWHKNEFGIDADWKEGTQSGPRYGCVEPYGCHNFFEDVATFTETFMVTAIPFYDDFHKQLIDPDSDFYKKNPDQRKYARVYREKLHLLRQYGFITEADYREFVPVHPDLLELCQSVFCP